jgi:hypothetical protein
LPARAMLDRDLHILAHGKRWKGHRPPQWWISLSLRFNRNASGAAFELLGPSPARTAVR